MTMSDIGARQDEAGSEKLSVLRGAKEREYAPDLPRRQQLQGRPGFVEAAQVRKSGGEADAIEGMSRHELRGLFQSRGGRLEASQQEHGQADAALDESLVGRSRIEAQMRRPLLERQGGTPA